MSISAHIEKLGERARSPWFHAAVAAGFVIAMAFGYRLLGGLEFVQGWGGGR